jgi:hypothetical protein
MGFLEKHVRDQLSAIQILMAETKKNCEFVSEG